MVEGQSYFRRNLARQLNQDYPVAFIEAWESDNRFAIYGLANALDTALQPFLTKDSQSEEPQYQKPGCSPNGRGACQRNR